MSPSVPPNVPQHEQEQQQQQEPVDPMIQRMMMMLNTPMQHPPVQRVDNFQDLQSQSLFNLEVARGRCAGSSQASAPTSFNQSAAIYPTLTSDGISICHVGQNSASSTNPAASLPMSGNFNHGVGQLPGDQLTNELNQGASREFGAMHPNAHTNQNPQLVARIRARRQVARAQLSLANYGLHSQIWHLQMQLRERDQVIQNLRMQLQQRNQVIQEHNQYVQLLENLVAEIMSQQDSTSE
ncbi:hypothetical protein C5167_038965 [Papaver somniferum]|uniref:Uncharacterized protein n=1 Tax=Papaver somniferum TaxID=3469 RepID=A0A4Y7IF23_PAPSO|nr:hypothetical protein C5167_038965 [Papaver somniferum]